MRVPQVVESEARKGYESVLALPGMSCAKTIPVDLSTWHDGQAKIVVMLVNHDHMSAPGAVPQSP
ncbi:hypothetical protein EPN44_07260 [bacterium]|nr:MAG: hypothetical protein EPN44_07260 [bacterium]